MKNNLILAILCCSITLQATASDEKPPQVAGAKLLTVDPDSVELFEQYDFQSSPGKLHFTIKLKPNQLYLPVHVASLHPTLTEGDPNYPYFVPRILRSLKLGKNVGVLFRYGSEIGSGTDGWSGRVSADYRIFLTHQANLKNWFAKGRLNMIIFRTGVVQHPQGAGFLSFNRYTQLSGPSADKLYSVFVLANADEEKDINRLRIFSGREWLEAHNYDWVTLHGKDTTLTVWINGKEKSITATSDDPRTNTFKLSHEKMTLADIDRLPGGYNGMSIPRIKITAPQRNWVTGAVKTPPPEVAQGNSPSDSLTISPNAKLSRILTGRWDSNLGQTDLVQTGTKVVGTLRSKDQSQISIIDGQLTGTRLDFTAFPIAGSFSNGYVLFNPEGNSGVGPYTSANGSTTTWMLTR